MDNKALETRLNSLGEQVETLKTQVKEKDRQLQTL